MARQFREIQTIEDLFRLYNNEVEFVAKTLHTTEKLVSTWKSRKQFPPTLYVAHQELLRRKRIKAPPHLWSMEPVPTGREETTAGGNGEEQAA